MSDEPKLKGCWSMARLVPTRVLKLTDQQVNDLRGGLCMDDIVESLGKIVLDVISRGVREREKNWRVIYELAGCDRAKDYVRVNWVKQEVEVWEGQRAALQADDHIDEMCQNSAIKALANAISSQVSTIFWSDVTTGMGDSQVKSECSPAPVTKPPIVEPND